ncbi:Beta-lactamase hydrolase-like protein [Pirellulimonas nuda]|uniref:Beta-lactamase hydrolase-like protein n=1 Tax=Pirellulimonas nuda TaxID=2528009 RepID=A0A518DFS7_9BACT|nr:MBL fold metallo-hydrolase [Pirellulimonas nuda]QDU90331.1 Beta-lactamase hydrolase-like protein [Pirellulimonas nuda]
MLLKYFYDKPLAHASYMVGCQKSGEAIVVDPGRDVSPYLEAAKAEGLRIVAATETHIHADFVSGSRELADRVGAKLYLSDTGPSDWKYAPASGCDITLLKDGDAFYVGKVKLEVLHTPGHTPESISLVLTDEGGGANAPMGVFTGDFVFVGSVGRPDLLETAAGVVGSAEVGARQLYESTLRFRTLPDHLQVWPAHGAGSACGKGLGAIPSSTVGYEKLFNPALQYRDEQAFVDYILADQPETPFYFAVMKRVNKQGPQLTEKLPPVEAIPTDRLAAVAAREIVLDTRPSGDFAQAHAPGTINVPASNLVQWAGFFVDYDKPVYLIADESTLGDRLRSLRSIGIDNVGGYFDAGAVGNAGLRTESYPSATPAQLRDKIEGGEVTLVDVRAATEYQAGHIAEAEHHFLGKLMRNIDAVTRDKPVVAQCLAGGRSAIAASILQRAGFEVVNMQGGYRAWVDDGLPTVR